MSAADAPLEAAFVQQLSSQSKHYRFLGGISELSPQLLARLCDVDGYDSMAFVATVGKAEHEIEIGVSRYAPTALEPDVREIAITVADDWQHQGLGKLLAEQLIDYAKTHGVKELRSVDLADNAHMRQLANALGMSARQDPADSHQVIYSLTL